MKIVIIGRPNVGKSTLFNRLVGKKSAIVDNISGVTRDWKCLPANIADLDFEIIDTAGLLGFEEDILAKQIAQQTHNVINSVDIILFTVEGISGVVNSDITLARNIIKKYNKKIILIANKCENAKTLHNLNDCHKLGMGDPVPLSAEHGTGIDLLYDILKDAKKQLKLPDLATTEENLQSNILNIAVVGKPNAGKSTLINKLIGDNRLLTGDTPGVTRDSISIDFNYNGRDINLVDTAGMRKKAKIDQRLERLSISDTIKSIKYSEITILVIDASMPLQKQDLTIAEHVIKEGRGLVIAVNKSDLQKGNWLAEIHRELNYILPQVKNIPCIAISAINGKNIDKLMQAVFDIETLWNTRISTSILNQWLSSVTSHHPPPLDGGRRIKIKYMTQIKTRPPTFVLFISKPAKLLDSYIRYLLNKLRADFNLPGTPIRFQVRKGKNPYDNKN